MADGIPSSIRNSPHFSNCSFAASVWTAGDEFQRAATSLPVPLSLPRETGIVVVKADLSEIVALPGARHSRAGSHPEKK